MAISLDGKTVVVIGRPTGTGVAAFKSAIGYLGVALTNGAADFLARSLALELAPVRVNAI